MTCDTPDRVSNWDRHADPTWEFPALQNTTCCVALACRTPVVVLGTQAKSLQPGGLGTPGLKVFGNGLDIRTVHRSSGCIANFCSSGSGGFPNISLILHRMKKEPLMSDAKEEEEKKALVALGMVVGIVGTFAAVVKAALDLAAAKQSEGGS